MSSAEHMLALIEAFDGSTSLQVEAIMELFDEGNTDFLMRVMPDHFRPHFIDWCSRIRRGGEPIQPWEPAFADGFRAICGWLDKNGDGT